jgi:hypothetical protein
MIYMSALSMNNITGPRICEVGENIMILKLECEMTQGNRRSKDCSFSHSSVLRREYSSTVVWIFSLGSGLMAVSNEALEVHKENFVLRQILDTSTEDVWIAVHKSTIRKTGMVLLFAFLREKFR